MLTLVASALADGDCIDDADVLRTGGTAGAIGCVVKAPSVLHHIAPNRTSSSKKRAKSCNVPISSGDRPSGLKCIRLFLIFLTRSRCLRNSYLSTFSRSLSQCSVLPSSEWYPAKVKSEAPLICFAAFNPR